MGDAGIVGNSGRRRRRRRRRCGGSSMHVGGGGGLWFRLINGGFGGSSPILTANGKFFPS